MRETVECRSNRNILFDVCLVALTGIVLRSLFFSGYMGSDDVVYIKRAMEIANNIWTSADYNGALRYGFNIPAGLLIKIFGDSLFVVNLWPMLCAIAEIVLLYFFVRYTLDRRTALIASIILASLPIHVCAATKVHVDSIISLFISLSYILFYIGLLQNRKWIFFLSGICSGFVFWCRELAIFYIIAFAVLPFFLKKQYNKKLIYYVLGGLLMLIMHVLLMYFISGDIFHFFYTIFGQIDSGFVHGTKIHDPFYYFTYLFFKPFHTGLVGYFALAGLVIMWLPGSSSPLKEHRGFFTFWAVSLVVLFSFFPISINPFKFVTKQSNYLIMFTTPIVLLSSYCLAKLPKNTFWVLFTAVFCSSIVLSAIEQQSRRVFVSNSKAVVSFLNSNPQAVVYGSVNNHNIAEIESMLNHSDISLRLKPLKQFQQGIGSYTKDGVYVVIDKETMRWSAKDLIIKKIPPCWEYKQTLKPEGFGLGRYVLELILKAAPFIKITPEKLLNKMEHYYRPQKADIYLVNKKCRSTFIDAQ